MRIRLAIIFTLVSAISTLAQFDQSPKTLSSKVFNTLEVSLDNSFRTCSNPTNTDLSEILSFIENGDVANCHKKRLMPESYCECISKIQITPQTKDGILKDWEERIKNEIRKEVVQEDVVDETVDRLISYYTISRMLNTDISAENDCSIALKESNNSIARTIHERFEAAKGIINSAVDFKKGRAGAHSYRTCTIGYLKNTIHADFMNGTFTARDNPIGRSIEENLIRGHERFSGDSRTLPLGLRSLQSSNPLQGSSQELGLRASTSGTPFDYNESQLFFNSNPDCLNPVPITAASADDPQEFNEHVVDILSSLTFRMRHISDDEFAETVKERINFFCTSELNKEIYDKSFNEPQSSDENPRVIDLYARLITDVAQENENSMMNYIESLVAPINYPEGINDERIVEDKFSAGVYYCDLKGQYNLIQRQMDDIDDGAKKEIADSLKNIGDSESKIEDLEARETSAENRITVIDNELTNRRTELTPEEIQALTTEKTNLEANLGSIRERLGYYRDISRRERDNIASIAPSAAVASFIIGNASRGRDKTSRFEPQGDGSYRYLDIDEYRQNIQENADTNKHAVQKFFSALSGAGTSGLGGPIASHVFETIQNKAERDLLVSQFENVEEMLNDDKGAQYFEDKYLNVPEPSQEQKVAAIKKVESDLVNQGYSPEKAKSTMQKVSDLYQSRNDVVSNVSTVMPKRKIENTTSNIMNENTSNEISTSEYVRISEKLFETNREIQQLTTQSNEILRQRNDEQSRQIQKLIDQNQQFQEQLKPVIEKNNETSLSNQGSLEDLSRIIEEKNEESPSEEIYQDTERPGPLTGTRSIAEDAEISPLSSVLSSVSNSGLTAIQNSITPPVSNVGQNDNEATPLISSINESEEETNENLNTASRSLASIESLAPSTITESIAKNDIPVLTLSEFEDVNTDDFISGEIDQLINKDKEFIVMTNGEQVLVRLFLNENAEPEFEIVGAVKNREVVEHLVREKISLVYQSKRVYRLLELDAALNNSGQ